MAQAHETNIAVIDSPTLSGTWQPMQREETIDLLESNSKLSEEARTQIANSSAMILGKCTSPHTPEGKETGLVVGYVQSGKTLSFTTVAALACDNGYPLVIVITGTSKPLHRQSTERLRKDLRYGDPNRARRWHLIVNPENVADTRHNIESTLRDWRDPSTLQEEKETILITVMKNHTHLNNLTALLNSIDLSNVPTLIIDDEADQASMNTNARQNRRRGQQKESTTYKRINELRNVLPHHSFLQYTATPQAPLLISIIDSLSPNFVNVLEPGQGYVGGREFFIEHPETHVRQIPINDVLAGEDDDHSEPPVSLHAALKVFFIGVAVGYMEGAKGWRSMLVHPSFATDKHRKYERWVRTAKSGWEKILSQGNSEPDYQDLIEEFKVAYNDLLRTEPNIPDFQAIEQRLPRAIRKTHIQVVNSKQGSKRGTPEVNWDDSYSWILIGGQSMDRGFTVEGLTVTYMPRGRGVGNADTIQQRGRFFGYKRAYFGYCRVYLQDEVSTAFRDYVQHEEDMRRQLVKCQETGQSLDEWKRAFILSRELRATRANVLELDYMRGNFSERWFAPFYLLDSKEAVEENRSIVDDFLGTVNSFILDEGDERRTDAQKHLVAKDVTLDNLLKNLLTRIRVAHPGDSQRYTGLLLQLERALEEANDELCSIYLMSSGNERARSLSDAGSVKNLYQGPYPDKDGEIYPGDSEIHHTDRVSIQIHKLRLTEGKKSGPLLASNVPVVAVWIPRRLGVDWIIQEDI